MFPKGIIIRGCVSGDGVGLLHFIYGTIDVAAYNKY